MLVLTVILVGTSITGTAYAKRSAEEAFHYQKHMAQAGYSSAIYKLGVMYQNGYGTPRNLAKALELYNESFRKGYKQAEVRINEVKLMMESGDFDKSEAKSRPAAKSQKESAQLKAEREKLRKEREAHELSKKHNELIREIEQRKLNEELNQLRAEKAAFEKEKRILKAKRKAKAKKELEKWRKEASAIDEDS
ncbi:MAG: hypothetical protein GQ470_01260 [Gammaproteobacteria bacterium]|nr:hypothetical protein [Gammaproteobacteria bacterium]